MNSRKLLLTAMIVLLTLGLAADGRTDISNSAVLFLRIAPGSRAAAMGEAYVAIADDATATHWNPAGLANAPLSDSWSDSRVPDEHRPLKSLASVSRDGDKGYLGVDIWALGAKGLVRYDNHKWSTEEVFGTKTDETMVRKVRNYFSVTDEARLEQIQDRVAAANNGGTLEELQQFRDQVLAAVPAEHRDLPQITADLDSLIPAWRECRLDWTNIREAQARLTDGLKDSVLSEDEVTRVSVALERSRNRFLPEEIKIPYSALFASEPFAVASSGGVLLVAASDGLARFNGVNWTLLTTADGLPSNAITTLQTVGRSIVVGTDSGVVAFNGLTIEPLATEYATMPHGVVGAIGGSAMNMLVAVIDGELYRFDGQSWKNTTTYTAVLDDTPERIADKFALSKSPLERQLYLEKYRAIFRSGDTVSAATPAVDSASDTMVTPMPAADSAAPAATAVVPGFDSPINPGDMLEVPMIARVKGKVNAIYVDRLNRIWLGTEYGVFWLDEQGWHAPGYKMHVVLEGETLDLFEDRRGYSSEAVPHSEVLADLNDISEANPLEIGDTILVTDGPPATGINAISGNGEVTLFATRRGAIQFDGKDWLPANLHGVGNESVIAVNGADDNVWVASDSRIVGKGNGRYEVSFMHVNWLPELANDMYYEFLAVAGPVRGIGTLGLNFTYLTYGTILRTGTSGSDTTGSFTAYDLAVTGSYGTSLTRKLKAGLSAKLIISRLADQGAGAEKGSGTSTGFAIDFGFLYSLTPRWTWGLAVTNLGPKMAYIDAAQSDELPRNLAFGTAYKLLDSDYSKMLFTLEMNKMLVGMGDGFREELKQLVLNGGAEFSYANLLALRGGYIFDQEGDVKAFTLGLGVKPMDWVQADFAYIPSQGDSPLSNTIRFSLRLLL